MMTTLCRGIQAVRAGGGQKCSSIASRSYHQKTNGLLGVVFN
jgi:hypothetical protein